MEDDYIPQTQEDIDNERARILSQARKQKSQMARLLENEDWKAYALHVQREIDKRFVELLSMPHSADDVIKKTYCTGEIAALKIAQDLPSVLIEYAQASIDSDKKAKEIENGETESPRADFSGGLFDDDTRDYPGTGSDFFKAP